MKRESKISDDCYLLINAIDDALYVIGGKWKLKILTVLLDSKLRFTEIQRAVKGISGKVLSEELKQLELNELVIKNSTENSDIIHYTLTEHAFSLERIIRELGLWGKKHREELIKNRHK